MRSSQQHFSLWRIIICLFLIILVLMIIAAVYMFTGRAPIVSKIDFGVTFSQPFAEKMGLDWRETYSAILDDLGAEKLRLVAYWPKIETSEDQYSFNDLDWQIKQAENKGTEVILTVGRKLPRWPECHLPEWAVDLSEGEQQAKVLKLLEKIVNHYQNSQAITAWQIENEPYLADFGQCPPLDENFLQEEIDLVRRLDKQERPIILTASGELSSWIKPARQADILGTTLYRIVWVDKIGKNIEYPIPPVFYYKRAKITKWLTGINEIFICELQAEPWGPKMIYETPRWKQYQSMDLDRFKEVIDYAYKTGFDEAYLWGVEWWYWLKKEGNGCIWSEAKKLFP